MGQEYIRAHHAFLQLAVRLSRVWLSWLRFDFYDSSDSAGGSDEGNIHQWISDFSTALDELKHSHGIRKVSIIGLRVGASLSFLAGAQRSDLKSIVLWEPVVNGKEYVQELIAFHYDWSLGVKSISEQLGKNNTNFEVLGFPITGRLRSNHEEINLLDIQDPPANDVLIIESEKRTSYLQLRDYIRKMGVKFTYRHLPEQRVWLKGEGMFKSLVPNETLQSTVNWITKVGS